MKTTRHSTSSRTPARTVPALSYLFVRHLQARLQEAGANVLLDEIASWTAAQIDDASAWATAQIAATRKSKPGRGVSLRWPDHVDAGHQGTVPDATSTAAAAPKGRRL